MKLLSIIVPIYNVEPYVEKCLRSLETQDISRDDFEIICINDGSPDNSREVVSLLQKEFNNIILVDQENQGVSRARNKGIDRAIGKYLLFIDSDDFVQVNSLGPILIEADLKCAQIAIPGYNYIDLSGNMQGIRTSYKFEEKVLNGIEAFYLTHEKGLMTADSSVGIIFEADFLVKNCLQYLADVPFNEDCEFLARAHCLADRCIFLENLLYTIVARQGSASRSNIYKTEKARDGFILAASNLKRFQREQSLSERQKLFINGPIVQFILLAIYNATTTKSIIKLRTTVNRLQALGLDKLSLEGCKGYYRICGRSYNLSPYLGVLVLVIYWRIVNWYNSFIRKKIYK